MTVTTFPRNPMSGVAVPLRRSKARRWLPALTQAVRAWSRRPDEPTHPDHRAHAARRESFMEHHAMSREMGRL